MLSILKVKADVEHDVSVGVTIEKSISGNTTQYCDQVKAAYFKMELKNCHLQIVTGLFLKDITFKYLIHCLIYCARNVICSP